MRKLSISKPMRSLSKLDKKRLKHERRRLFIKINDQLRFYRKFPIYWGYQPMPNFDQGCKMIAHRSHEEIVLKSERIIFPTEDPNFIRYLLQNTVPPKAKNEGFISPDTTP